MSQSHDRVLADELGKVGRISGPGGGWGARLMAFFLPTVTFSTTLRIEAAADEVLQAVREILSRSCGEMSESGTEPSGVARLSGVTGSGFGGLNPTILEVEITPADQQTTTVHLTGAAKDGLIKQRSAEQAVLRLREELLQVLA